MDIQGLGWRTDLALLEISGSLLEDRDDHVSSGRHNPTFSGGNFVMLAGPAGRRGRRAAVAGGVRGGVPGTRHRTFGIDGMGGSAADGDRSPHTRRTDVSSVMTATSVHEPARPNHDATYRPLESDADWEQQVELTMVGEEIGYDREFCEGRARQHRGWPRPATGSTGARSRTATCCRRWACSGPRRTGPVPDRQDPPGRPRQGPRRDARARDQPVRVRRPRRRDPGHGRRPRVPRDPGLPQRRVRRHRGPDRHGAQPTELPLPGPGSGSDPDFPQGGLRSRLRHLPEAERGS